MLFFVVLFNFLVQILWSNSVSLEHNLARSLNGAFCTSNNTDCVKLFDGNIHSCDLPALQPYSEINVTLKEKQWVASINFMFCSEQSGRGLKQIWLQFENNVEYELDLKLWKSRKKYNMFEAVFFTPVYTGWVLFRAHSTVNSTYVSLAEVSVFNSEQRLNVASSFAGATCTSTACKNCENALNSYDDQLPKHNHELCIINRKQDVIGSQINVTFLQEYTIYSCRFFQVYEDFSEYSSCNIKEVELTFDNNTKQIISLHACESDDINKKLIYLNPPVLTKTVSITILSLWNNSSEIHNGFAEIEMFSGSPYVPTTPVHTTTTTSQMSTTAIDEGQVVDNNSKSIPRQAEKVNVHNLVFVAVLSALGLVALFLLVVLSAKLYRNAKQRRETLKLTDCSIISHFCIECNRSKNLNTKRTEICDQETDVYTPVPVNQPLTLVSGLSQT